MGFLEKLKNTFFEEEYVEVEEKVKPRKEVVKEVKRTNTDIKPLREEDNVRNVRRDEIVHEGLPDKIKEEKIERTIEKVKVEPKKVQKEKFSYFDEDDFIDFKEETTTPIYSSEKERFVEERVVEERPKVYNNPEYAKKNKVVSTPTIKQSSSNQSTAYSKQSTAFKPTPIISPIYGILDQNYTKDEIADRRENRPSSYVSRKNADLDSIREKAFGTLTSDLGLTEQANDEPIVEENDIKLDEMEDNLLYDMTDISTTPTVDKVTLQDAEEYFQDLGLEYNIDYKDAKLERATGRRVAKTPKTVEIEEDEVSNTKKQKKNEEYLFSMEDNLFDLIDSMYEEKE